MLMRDDQCNLIGLLGAGRLYEAVYSHLEQTYQLTQCDITQPPCLHYSLLVLVEDNWQPQTHALVNSYSLKHSIPWLRVSIEFGTGILGPCVFPRESGCVTCIETRRVTAMREAVADARALCTSVSQEIQERDQSWLTSFGVDVLASLVAEEVTSCVNTPGAARTR